jgi:hypothetical protein
MVLQNAVDGNIRWMPYKVTHVGLYQNPIDEPKQYRQKKSITYKK